MVSGEVLHGSQYRIHDFIRAQMSQMQHQIGQPRFIEELARIITGFGDTIRIK